MYFTAIELRKSLKLQITIVIYHYDNKGTECHAGEFAY